MRKLPEMLYKFCADCYNRPYFDNEGASHEKETYAGAGAACPQGDAPL